MRLFSKKRSNLPRRRTLNADRGSSLSAEVFRRNRTMTGSASNNLRPAAINPNNDFESPRSYVHHLSIKRRKIFGILSVFVLIAAVIGLFLCVFTANTMVTVSDQNLSKNIDRSRYEKAIQDYLCANPLNRFRFALDDAALLRFVTAKLPEVEGIKQAGFAGLGKTEFTLKMRKPIASWTIGEKQFFVDQKGVSFENNYFQNPEVQIVDESGAQADTGATVASKRFLGFAGQVVSLAKNAGYNVTQAILPRDTTRMLEIQLSEFSFSVKLSIDRPAGEQIEDMSRAVEYILSKNKNISYLDVRVSGKAFYK